MDRPLLGFLAVWACLATTGCISVGTERIRDPAAVAKIQPGIAPADATELLGQPSFTLPLDGGQELWVYQHEAGRVRPLTYVPLIGLFVGGYTVEYRALTILWSAERRALRIGGGTWSGGREGVQDNPPSYRPPVRPHSLRAAVSHSLGGPRTTIDRTGG